MKIRCRATCDLYLSYSNTSICHRDPYVMRAQGRMPRRKTSRMQLKSRIIYSERVFNNMANHIHHHPLPVPLQDFRGIPAKLAPPCSHNGFVPCKTQSPQNSVKRSNAVTYSNERHDPSLLLVELRPRSTSPSPIAASYDGIGGLGGGVSSLRGIYCEARGVVLSEW